MTFYLETSVLVSLFAADIHTPSARRFARTYPDCQTSLWALAEASSALALQVRVGRLEPAEAAAADAHIDRWLVGRPEPETPIADDLLAARRMLRAASSPLRAADALHLALSERLGTTLATFDKRLVMAAIELGAAAVDLDALV